MKIALLQFAPDVGTVQANIKRADDLLQRAKIPVDLDWLILPEMAFSGYNFHSLEEITPYLEPTTSGITTHWAIQVAQHYNCHVTVGYPERTLPSPSSPHQEPTNYNSTVTVSPTGAILQNYRKSFLYYTDETWAAEPPERFKVEHLQKLGNVIQGICMDINPHRFLAPWSDYEFASAALAPVPPLSHSDSPTPQGTNPLIVVSMAWLSHLTASEIAAEPAAPDVATVAYWVERFQPVVERSKDVPGPWYVVLANRCGSEKSVCYAGSSTVIKVEDGGVSLFETCGRGEERVCVVDLEGEPRFSVRSGR
ncbi:carbon-nitrogen hydrolase [Paraphaeosphaeria sporulosa]|uniref:Carbon-nitrogen hydrolase n=1 Tax=Paraphaeosphaeria sporulosa TaxID=1460663 RepID=A0A177CG56_9PLEO|nr:carbon-nitrogen hydrolase [Paraphaeosphaeria sporulosa]OAG05730.1 carbon-nitrogen hydrolase [Paraphaeosphaeria sporulosa]